VDEENISKTYQDDSSNLIKKMLKSDPEMFEGLKLIVESMGAWLVSKLRVVFNAPKVQIPPQACSPFMGQCTCISGSLVVRAKCKS